MGGVGVRVEVSAGFDFLESTLGARGDRLGGGFWWQLCCGSLSASTVI